MDFLSLQGTGNLVIESWMLLAHPTTTSSSINGRNLLTGRTVQILGGGTDLQHDMATWALNNRRLASQDGLVGVLGALETNLLAVAQTGNLVVDHG